MQINYYAVLVCGLAAMVLGSIWYGPLFGKKWMEIIKATPAKTPEEKKKMMSQSMPLYVIQFVLVLFQAWVLAYYIAGWKDASGFTNSLWIWAAFVMPTVAACSMWTNDSRRIVWARFLIQAGYNLVLFVMFGLILGMWK
ncbi:MAG: hypothetical protein A3B90_00560 [Candidatus Magasanikbacteria bacterium RIFCSPHIGHO2_02_FULL_41_13]|uniref:DUF1761 domain-containing protein n=1 Tax=Candidatus Magasanikbacteria bacterium RIFCSPHIGHO2_02_FULL_41_13 TaxID=1798676 RepID=A0A1F6M628_9BACT|nr:MAG: hypothetical protein A3B90_00560 [Candidatus Magasanikbacteria bacterium RIFCSPHIGHO2_02_FULL_41_13]